MLNEMHIVLQSWSLTIISINGGLTAFNRRGGPLHMVRAIWGFRFLQCINRDGSIARPAVPFLLPKALPWYTRLSRIENSLFYATRYLYNQVLIDSYFCYLAAEAWISSTAIKEAHLLFHFALHWRLIIIGLFFSQWLAALSNPASVIVVIIMISLKSFKDLRHCTHQGFSFYCDPTSVHH